MSGIDLLEMIMALLIAVLALAALAQRLLVPYPIVLVVGGLAFGAVPGVPSVPLPPDLVFLVFLPPILGSAAYLTSWRDFRANLRPIGLLALGLVVVTTGVVAWVARAVVPGMPWGPALALGAIVSPPDAVAATALARRLGVPRRVVVILEGESLVNDASALILYRAAVAAVVGGGFDFSSTLLEFAVGGAGGVAIGVAVAAVATLALRWVSRDGLISTAVTLVAPYSAWVLGDQAGASAVLACVASGLYLRRRFSAAAAP